jgi:type VI secretion system protein ImpA
MTLFLEPIPGENPCGIDLSNDIAYYELGQMIAGKQAGMIVDRDGQEAGKSEDADWGAVLQKCDSLLEKSKDLQVFVTRVLALLQVRGLPGLAEGLESLAANVRNFWGQLYPPIEEDGDPMQRVNILASIAQPMGCYGDPVRFIERLRAAPLLKVPMMGPITYEFLSGTSSPGDGPQVSNMLHLQEFLKAVDPAELERDKSALKRSLAAVQALDSFLEETIGVARSPSWEVLLSTLRDQARIYEGTATETKASKEARAGGAAPDAAQGYEAGDTEGSAASGGFRAEPATFRSAAVSSGLMTIASDEDVMRCLDLICKYYAQAEPSSPVPILLQRARRLVRKNFFQVIEDLAPEAAEQLRALAGLKNEAPAEN